MKTSGAMVAKSIPCILVAEISEISQLQSQEVHVAKKTTQIVRAGAKMSQGSTASNSWHTF